MNQLEQCPDSVFLGTNNLSQTKSYGCLWVFERDKKCTEIEPEIIELFAEIAVKGEEAEFRLSVRDLVSA